MSLWKGDLGVVPGFEQLTPGNVLVGTEILAFDEYPLEAGPKYLVIGTHSKIYRWTGTGYMDLSGATYNADLDNVWQVGMVVNPAGDLLQLWSELKDPVQKWDGSAATFVNLLGSTSDAGLHYSRVCTDFQNHLMHLNRIEDGVKRPRKLVWSDNGVPELYTGGESGFLTLFQGADWGLTLEPMSVYMVAYRERSIHLISYIGAPFFMAQRQVINGTGPISPRGVLNFDNRHAIFGSDNLYWFNGVDLEPFGDAVRDDIFTRMDPRYSSRSLLLFDEIRNDIIVVVPTAFSNGIPDTWWYYNVTTKAWSGPREGRQCTGGGNWEKPGTTPRSWLDIAGRTWQQVVGPWLGSRDIGGYLVLLFGNSTLKPYIIDDTTVLEDGVEVVGRLESGVFYPGRQIMKPFSREATCTKMLFFGDPPQQLVNFFVGSSEAVDGPYNFNGPYTQGVRGVINVKPTTGKWFKFAFETSSPIRLSGLMAEFERAG